MMLKQLYSELCKDTLNGGIPEVLTQEDIEERQSAIDELDSKTLMGLILRGKKINDNIS